MNVRKYSPLDYEVVGEWFKDRAFPMEAWMLPSNGWVYEDQHGPLAACWLYTGDTPIAFLEWSVTRPKASPLKALKAMKQCIKSAQEFAKDIGLRAVLQFIPDERLVKYYENHCDFQATEKATLMVWPVK